MNILMQKREKVLKTYGLDKDSNQFGKPQNWFFWCSVARFLKFLFFYF